MNGETAAGTSRPMGTASVRRRAVTNPTATVDLLGVQTTKYTCPCLPTGLELSVAFLNADVLNRFTQIAAIAAP
jgi:hypothetical protein